MLNISDRNHKSIRIVPIESIVPPLELAFPTGGEAFWLDSRTVGKVVDEGEGKEKVKALYLINIRFEPDSVFIASVTPTLIGKFPTNSATNFRYTGRSGFLVFSDYVFPDGDLKTAKEQDEAWENRGNTAFVYDETFERHVRWAESITALVLLISAPNVVGHVGRTEAKLYILGEAHTRSRP